MARRGRRRSSTALREPNGRKQRPQQSERDMTPQALLHHRAAAAGIAFDPRSIPLLKDQRAGSALGLLWVRGQLGHSGADEREYRAGEALGAAWRAWDAMAGCPPRTPLCSEGGGMSEPDAEAWQTIRRRYEDVRAEVMRVPAGILAWRMLESVIMDGIIPLRLLDRQPWVIGWKAFHDGLDAAAKFFRIQTEENQKVAA